MRHSRALSVAFLLIAAVPSGALGQDTNRAAALRSLSAGDSVRLDVSGLGRVEGRFIVTNAMGVTLTSRASSMQVPAGDIERLWVRERATREGTLIGTGVGLVVGIVGGLLISRVACEPVDGGDCTAAEVAVVGGLVAGAGGAVLGAGVGFAVFRWHLRFE